MKHALAPILILFSPAIFLTALYIMLLFGWVLAIDILQAEFLQTPKSEGGYGFTTLQNGYCKFIPLQCTHDPD